MKKIAILGAGMAGFGAAHRLFSEGIKSDIYEKKSYYGGHAASFKYKSGFIFDDGPHISFTKVKRIQELFAKSVSQEYEKLQARTTNYRKGQWIKHPVQRNLYGLPTNLTVDIIKDFVKAQSSQGVKTDNFAEWLIAAYGKTFARTFPMEYAKKFHTTRAENLSTDWLENRFYQPTLEELLHGALNPTTPDVHYIDHFRYPSKNGFASYFNMFLNQADLKLEHELIAINPKTKKLQFANGFETEYDYTISSIPLPELMPLIIGVPKEVLSASKRLSCSICVIVNIGVDREDICESHWAYFYDQDIIFTRLSFPHMFSLDNAPPQTGSIQAEVYFSNKYKPMKSGPESYIQPVVKDLIRCGLLREDDKIVFKNAWASPYANVIFDLERAGSLEIVHGYLNEIGIPYCGRYGEWKYIWTDESFMSGESAAQNILDRLS